MPADVLMLEQAGRGSAGSVPSSDLLSLQVLGQDEPLQQLSLCP